MVLGGDTGMGFEYGFICLGFDAFSEFAGGPPSANLRLSRNIRAPAGSHTNSPRNEHLP